MPSSFKSFHAPYCSINYNCCPAIVIVMICGFLIGTLSCSFSKCFIFVCTLFCTLFSWVFNRFLGEESSASSQPALPQQDTVEEKIVEDTSAVNDNNDEGTAADSVENGDAEDSEELDSTLEDEKEDDENDEDDSSDETEGNENEDEPSSGETEDQVNKDEDREDEDEEEDEDLPQIVETAAAAGSLSSDEEIAADSKEDNAAEADANASDSRKDEAEDQSNDDDEADSESEDENDENDESTEVAEENEDEELSNDVAGNFKRGFQTFLHSSPEKLQCHCRG